MTKEELDKITNYIAQGIMRNRWKFYNEDGVNHLMDIVATLHNKLYEEVTGKRYDYMYHWANKCGACVDDDISFEPKEGDMKYV